MLVDALIAIPFLAGLAAFMIRADHPRRALLVFTALVHLALTATVCLQPEPLDPTALLGLDPVGRVFLAITSLVYLAAALHAPGYLSRED
ncbi:MAG: NADH dehydrogenase FAD-containing subunit, partial [Candidatus Eremiobacterota bacterium]